MTACYGFSTESKMRFVFVSNQHSVFHSHFVRWNEWETKNLNHHSDSPMKWAQGSLAKSNTIQTICYTFRIKKCFDDTYQIWLCVYTLWQLLVAHKQTQYHMYPFAFYYILFRYYWLFSFVTSLLLDFSLFRWELLRSNLFMSLMPLCQVAYCVILFRGELFVRDRRRKKKSKESWHTSNIAYQVLQMFRTFSDGSDSEIFSWLAFDCIRFFLFPLVICIYGF